MSMSTPFVHHPTPLTPSRINILISLAATAIGIALLLWLDSSLPFILAFCATWGIFDLVDFRTRKTNIPSRVEVDDERISITRCRTGHADPVARIAGAVERAAKTRLQVR